MTKSKATTGLKLKSPPYCLCRPHYGVSFLHFWKGMEPRELRSGLQGGGEAREMTESQRLLPPPGGG